MSVLQGCIDHADHPDHEESSVWSQAVRKAKSNPNL